MKMMMRKESQREHERTKRWEKNDAKRKESERTLSLQEPSDSVPLIRRDARKDLLGRLHVSSKNGGLVVDQGDGERVAVDVDVLVGQVDLVLGRKVAEKVHVAARKKRYESKVSDCHERRAKKEEKRENSLVEMVDGVRLISDEVAELVGSGGVDEAVSDPLGGLDAAAEEE